MDANTTDRINRVYYAAKNVQYSSTGLYYVPVLSYSDYSGWQRDQGTQVIWPGNSLQVPTSDAKLEGIKLKLCIAEQPPFVNVQNITDAYGNTILKFTGYILDLIDNLHIQLKFIPDIPLVPGSQYYNDPMNDVANGTYHTPVGDVTVTSARSKKWTFQVQYLIMLYNM